MLRRLMVSWAIFAIALLPAAQLPAAQLPAAWLVSPAAGAAILVAGITMVLHLILRPEKEMSAA